MVEGNWVVDVVGQARKADKNLSKSAATAFALLLKELIVIGPYRSEWPNYSKIKGSVGDYHCHVEKGRPTHVVCWRITDKKKKLIEVYYAGTHEKAPY